LYIYYDYFFNYSIISTITLPNKFSPFQFSGSSTPLSFSPIPIPQILSYGLASTKVLSPVCKICCFKCGNENLSLNTSLNILHFSSSHTDSTNPKSLLRPSLLHSTGLPAFNTLSAI